MKDKISIAMATYNGERFLREQLDSLYTQTRLPDEIVVCDDCSTDSTANILEEYHQKYGLKYYINEESLGVNKNFFKAMSLCSGDYICICDQDDIWLPNKILTLYNSIKEYDDLLPNCVSSQRIDINAQGERMYPYKKMLPDTEGWEATLLTNNRSQGCTIIMNAKLKDRVLSLYDKYPVAASIVYDAFISYVCAIEGHKKNLGAQLMYYRHHDKNVIAKYNPNKRNLYERIKTCSTYYPFFVDKQISDLSIINTIYKNKRIQDDIRLFLSQIAEINSSPSFFHGLSIILKLPIPTYLKLKTCFFSTTIYICKLLVL